MTCDELKMLEAEDRSVIETLDESIASGTTSANTQFGNILPQDTYGGTLPSADPLTSAGVQARITFLQTLNPPPGMLIMRYYGLLGTLTQIDGWNNSRTVYVAQLGSVLQQEIEQGC